MQSNAAEMIETLAAHAACCCTSPVAWTWSSSLLGWSWHASVILIRKSSHALYASLKHVAFIGEGPNAAEPRPSRLQAQSAIVPAQDGVPCIGVQSGEPALHESATSSLKILLLLVEASSARHDESHDMVNRGTGSNRLILPNL